MIVVFVDLAEAMGDERLVVDTFGYIPSRKIVDSFIRCNSYFRDSSKVAGIHRFECVSDDETK